MVYTRLTIGGRKEACLLDTGSEVSLIPARLIAPGLWLEPYPTRVRAANDTPLEILGAVELPGMWGTTPVVIRGLVTPHVEDVLLGEGFLQEYKVLWDHSQGTVLAGGECHKLFEHRGPASAVRRLILEGDTEVSPRCQMTVLGQVVFRPFEAGEWMSSTGELLPDLHVARTIVPDRCCSVPVRVANLGSQPLVLLKGMDLGRLELAQALAEDGSTVPSSGATGPSWMASMRVFLGTYAVGCLTCWLVTAIRFPPGRMTWGVRTW